MTKLFLFVMAATLMLAGSASAQDNKNASDLKPALNCHPPSEGLPARDSQDAGQSAILPSAGGNPTSGAPTVQRDGLPVVVREDCPPVLSPIDGKPKG